MTSSIKQWNGILWYRILLIGLKTVLKLIPGEISYIQNRGEELYIIY